MSLPLLVPSLLPELMPTTLLIANTSSKTPNGNNSVFTNNICPTGKAIKNVHPFAILLVAWEEEGSKLPCSEMETVSTSEPIWHHLQRPGCLLLRIIIKQLDKKCHSTGMPHCLQQDGSTRCLLLSWGSPCSYKLSVTSSSLAEATQHPVPLSFI